MKYHIAVIPGDGIGPEIVREAKKVLDKVGEVYGHQFEYEELYMGGCSIDATGVPPVFALVNVRVAVLCSASPTLMIVRLGVNVNLSTSTVNSEPL